MTTVLICLAIAAILLFGCPRYIDCNTDDDIDCDSDDYEKGCLSRPCCKSRSFRNLDFCCTNEHPTCCDMTADSGPEDGTYYRWCCPKDHECSLEQYKCVKNNQVITVEPPVHPDALPRAVWSIHADELFQAFPTCWPVQCHMTSIPQIRWNCPLNATCFDDGDESCRFPNEAARAVFERKRRSNECEREMALMPSATHEIFRLASSSSTTQFQQTRSVTSVSWYYEIDDLGRIRYLKPKSKQNFMRQTAGSCWPVHCPYPSASHEWRCPLNAICSHGGSCSFPSNASRDVFMSMIRTPICAEEVSITPPAPSQEHINIRNGRPADIARTQNLIYYETHNGNAQLLQPRTKDKVIRYAQLHHMVRSHDETR